MTHSSIKDSGARFQIVPSTRKITVPPSCRTIGTVGDINSEQLTFQCPKLIDGHDIKGCAEHYVTWQNANGDKGHDHLELLEEDDECLYFAWTVRGETTTTAGIVSFSIHFEDRSESGKVIYHWGTAECAECEILDTVNAVVGTFASVYVDANTLVFADHTPVMDKTLMLETPGIVPSGEKLIQTNGTHDVYEVASVNVLVPSDRPPVIEVVGSTVVASDGTPHNVTTYQLNAPTVNVDADGTVRATSYGLVTERPLHSFDPQGMFNSNNIKEGVTVFGVTGAYNPLKTVAVTFENIDTLTCTVHYYTVYNSKLYYTNTELRGGEKKTIEVMQGTRLSVTYLSDTSSVKFGVLFNGESIDPSGTSWMETFKNSSNHIGASLDVSSWVVDSAVFVQARVK